MIRTFIQGVGSTRVLSITRENFLPDELRATYVQVAKAGVAANAAAHGFFEYTLMEKL